jgi:hypothetical protein
MAIVKEITINLNDDDAKKGLSDINKLFKEVDQSEQKAVESTMSLRAELKKLQTDLQSGKLTGAAFDEGIKKAGLMKDQIIDVNNRIKALATDSADVALRGIGDFANGAVGAFSAVQGGMALFGNESQDVQKAIMKLQATMTLLNGVTAINNALQADSAGMMALQSAKVSVLTGLQTLYATVVGTSTGALKLFKIALISTGIGAIVVALGLLVANFESISKWVTDLIDKFGGWRKVLLMVSPPIYAIIKALEYMGVIDDEATSKAKANAEARIKANQKEVKALDKKKKDLEDFYDFEIRKAQASGGNVEAVEAKKRQAFLQTLKAQNELERSWIRTSKATEDDIKRWNERQKEIVKITQDSEIAKREAVRKAEEKKSEARQKAFEKNEALKQKEIDNEKKRQDDILKLNETYAKQLEDLNAKTEQEKLDLERKRAEAELKNLSATAEQKIALKLLYDKKEAELDDKLKEEQRLKEQERQNKINEILKIEREETKLQQLEREKIERLEELERLDASELEKNALRVKYMDLIRNEIRINQDAELEREKLLQAQKISMLGNSFGEVSQLLGEQTKAGKAFAIAQALINTYQGISNVWAEKSESGLVGLGLAQRILTTGIVAAKGFATVKRIMSVSTSGGGGGASMSGGGGSVPSAPSAAPIFNTIGASPVNQLTRALGDQPPVQAFVVGSQVTSQQSLDRNIIQNASLGG